MHCNNCGNGSHGFKDCRIPITSYGIVHYHQGKYLMIRRRNTLGFVDFMRGRYTFPNNVSVLRNLVDEMTLEEKANLMQDDFSLLSRKLWNSDHQDFTARSKFEMLRNSGLLKDVIMESKTSWDSQEWGFPKGRRNHHESELSSALREYEEETGYTRANIELVKNLLPYEEIFVGSNFKTYKHKYFLGFGEPPPTAQFEENEVSAMHWVTLEQALELIRPYNVERKNLLEQIDMFIKTFYPTK